MFRTYTVLGVETGPVHHQQLDHLESVDSHGIVHGRVSVLWWAQMFSMSIVEFTADSFLGFLTRVNIMRFWI